MRPAALARAFLPLVVAAALGAGCAAVENPVTGRTVFRGEREATPDDPVEELQLSRKEQLLLAKLLPNGHAVLQLGARRGTNVALAWLQLRSGAAALSALFPERKDAAPATQTALHQDGDSTV